MKQLWLILTRHIDGGDMVVNMILLKRRDGVFERADMMRLNVKREKALLLRDLGLHRLRGIMV